jgi:parallel beta-helix repeat protein
MRRLALALLVLSACASDDPCQDVSGQCIGLTEGATGTEVEQALIDVASGGTVAFGPGTYDFQTDLSLGVDDVTIQGAGMDQTILSFANQADGAQGLQVMANGFAIHDLAIQDTPGDALKILGGDGVTIERVRVEWTDGPNETNGSYGLYPVQCTHVLIADSVVKGASDSGVYVGQSDQIIVQGNDVEDNVAGIEIENSMHADVHDNVATANTGGILVFNLPDLQVENGTGTRVYDNQVFDNNTENFAPAGNIVGLVPTGTGIAVMAGHDVEIFGNDIHDQKSINIGVISYVPTMIDVTDDMYDPYPTGIYIHDNTLAGTSDMPTGELGALLISALGEITPQGPFIVPDVAWDGALDPARVDPGTGDYADADKICLQDNGDADFLDIAWPLGDATLANLDASPHDCAHPPLPAVVLP